MNEILIVNSALLPLITSLVEVAKDSGMQTKFAPLSSIIIGVVFSTVISWATLSAFTPKVAVLSAIVGVITGLAACGLYSGVKTYGTNNATESSPESEA